MNSRTVLIDPNGPPPRRTPTPHLARLEATRWVTRAGDATTWTMTNPGLSRRHRRVAALAYAPLNPRVLIVQVIAPSLGVCLVGVIAGIGLAQMFASRHIPGALIIGSLLAIAMAAAALSLVTRWRQGTAQAAHVVQVTGAHARALIEIEGEIAAYNRTCRFAGAKLSAPELLWNAAHDERAAVAIARTLAVLPPEEDVRVLDHLHTLTDEAHAGPGNVTTLQHMVRWEQP